MKTLVLILSGCALLTAQTAPFSIRYPSDTSKTKSPVTVLTWPPPIFFTNKPLGTEARMAAGSMAPGWMYVFVIRTIGRKR